MVWYRSRICFLMLALGLYACQEQSGVAGKRAAALIAPAAISGHIAYLAHDSLAGRAPATPGSEIGMRYIAEQYKAAGLQPGAGEGEWYQWFDIIGTTTRVPESMRLTRSGRSLSLRRWDDFIAFSGIQQPEAAVRNAEIVFVGYGIEAPEYQWNDYKEADLRGKVALIMNNDPAGRPDDSTFFGGDARLSYGRWDYKYAKAAEKGAVGAIIIHTEPSAGYPFQVVQSSWSREQFSLPDSTGPRMALKGWTTEAATRRIVKLAGKDLDVLRAAAEKPDFSPVRTGIRLSFRMQNTTRKLRTANVLGLLRGADPKRSHEVIVYTGHHDHLGITRPVDGDSINNGAVDNASGIAVMLTVAKAFGALPTPPRRSILFAAVAAEESGLLGSAYFAAHPTFPPVNIAANINLDSENVFGETRDIEIIGFGKSDLDAVVAAAAGEQGRMIIPDRHPDKGYYYRSDQYNFARIGVPAVYLGSGTDFVGREPGWGEKMKAAWISKHYHQPSDEFDPSWDLRGAALDGQLSFKIGLRLANRDAMPAWNPGAEFAAIRDKMKSTAQQE